MPFWPWYRSRSRLKVKGHRRGGVCVLWMLLVFSYCYFKYQPCGTLQTVHRRLHLIYQLNWFWSFSNVLYAVLKQPSMKQNTFVKILVMISYWIYWFIRYYLETSSIRRTPPPRLWPLTCDRDLLTRSRPLRDQVINLILGGI